MTDIKAHRDNLIALFTKSLDQCIAQQEALHPSSVVTGFEADIKFDMTEIRGGDINIKAGDGPGGGDVHIVGGVYRAGQPAPRAFEIRCRPALDLTRPYDSTFPTEVKVIETSADS